MDGMETMGLTAQQKDILDNMLIEFLALDKR